MNYQTEIYKWNKFSILKLKEDNLQEGIENDILKFIKNCDLKNKNVIDGGSNIGIFSLYLSKRIDKGIVCAFEMQPVIYQIGCDNAARNNSRSIVAFNKALSDKSGEKVGFSFIDYAGKNISSTGIRTEPLLRGEIHCGEIETVAIDDLYISDVGLIKLDLEGYEPQALEGMWSTIDKWKPYLIIELSPGYLEGKVYQMIDKIISHGYLIKEVSGFNYCCEPI